MKRLIEFVTGFSVTEWMIIVGLLVVCGLAVSLLFGKAGSAINEQRITRLETEKQQALKRAQEAEKRDLILQGKIEAKDEQIQFLTSQIAESNQRVVNAHNETQSARATVSKVRSDAPHFDSADDAGRIRELQSGLRELYPDTP